MGIEAIRRFRLAVDQTLRAGEALAREPLREPLLNEGVALRLLCREELSARPLAPDAERDEPVERAGRLPAEPECVECMELVADDVRELEREGVGITLDAFTPRKKVTVIRPGAGYEPPHARRDWRS